MTHRLEAAAAAARNGNNDLYDDPDTGGSLNTMMPSSNGGTAQYVALQNLSNPTYGPADLDDDAYENLAAIPGTGNSLAAIKVGPHCIPFPIHIL